MKIQDIIKKDEPLLMPGAYDAIGAKIAQNAGFDAIFQTGYGTSASLLGMPDYGFIGASETINNAKRITSAVSIPVMVDADTGYGNALSVWKTVNELESVNAAGIFLEDQMWPKKCGHMQGKQVISQLEYTEKLGAAIDARQSKDFFIVARTDARSTDGLDEAIQRGQENKKTGADAIFIEAPKSIDEMKQIAKEIKGPLVANMIEGGATPVQPAKELYKMGFNMIVYPLSILFANTYASITVLKELNHTGSTHKCTDRMVSFDQFNDLVDLEKFINMENKYKTKE